MTEIFVSAGEASSDMHGARLLEALRAQKGFENLKSFGLGGDKLAAQGTSLFLHASEFSVGGGPAEILSKLPKRKKLERLLEARLQKSRPCGAILIDNGEINLRLASLLNFFGVPVVYFIPPKLWAWRFSRIERIAHHVKLVLGLFPFEKEIYDHWEVPFQYIGNPLVDEVPFNLTPQQAKEKLGISTDTPVLAMLPGSRHTEIRHHAEVFSQAIEKFLKYLPPSYPKPQIVIPVAPTLSLDEVKQAFGPRIPNVRFFEGLNHECLKASRAALVKSGTSTLEAGLLGVPMVLAYKTSPSATFLYHLLVRYKGHVGMVNLVLADNVDDALGWGLQPQVPVVPELILEKCKPEAISTALIEAYVDGAPRSAQLKAFEKLIEKSLPPKEAGRSPFAHAAKLCAQVFSG